nr:hypothetical protein [Tanacetum cinerariifolium]
MNTASTSGSGHLPSNTIAKGELKATTTRSGIVLDGPSVPIPPLFINLEEDERVEETLTDQDLAEYTIKVPPPLVQKSKPPSQRNFIMHQRDPLHHNIPYPSRMHKQKQQEKDEKMLKALLSNKETLLELANTPLNENCSAVMLKKLPEKIRDLGKFLILCSFSELKCKALADLEVKDDIFNPEGGNVLIEKFLDHDSIKYPRKKLLNINLLIAQIKSLDDNPTPDHVLKPPSLFPIPVEDDDSFLEKSDTSLFDSDNSLPEYKTIRENVPSATNMNLPPEKDHSPLFAYVVWIFLSFLTYLMVFLYLFSFESKIFYFNIEEKNSGSTTIHADISLSDLECFNFMPDPGELTSIVVDFRIRENVPSATNMNLPPEKDDSPLFAYVVRIFLSFLTYLMVFLYLLSFGNEDTFFDTGIANYHFPYFLSDVSHWCETFMKFNVYLKLLNESPMEILSSSCSSMDQ